jgi:acyl-CoA synthetase (NDP forming)
VYAISGGTGAHMADLLAEAGLRLPDLGAGTQTALRQWIPDYLRVSNPVDNGGAPSADERGRKILDAIVADPAVDAIVCPITGALASMSKPLARDLVAVAETTDKPICAIWGSPVSDEDAYRILLASSKVITFRTFGNCVQAVRAWADWHAFRTHYRSPFARPRLRALATPARDRLARDAGAVLIEHEAKELLADYGIPVTREEVVSSARDAVRAAERIGWPVVLKASSADILHKSDVGLVRTGITSARQLRDAYAAIAEQAPEVLVAEQVDGGVETVVGVSHDELFGPVVLFGLGGVFVEVLDDVTFRVPPFDKAEARRMVEEVRAFPLLRGARGRPPADLAALIDVIVKVQRLALDCAAELSELDINPLVVRPKGGGAIALDALAVAR